MKVNYATQTSRAPRARGKKMSDGQTAGKRADSLYRPTNLGEMTAKLDALVKACYFCALEQSQNKLDQDPCIGILIDVQSVGIFKPFPPVEGGA
jgi:hypothetical protein